MSETKPRTRPNPHAFNNILKALIDQHFSGELEPAARAIGVSSTTLRGWVKGTKIPGFKRQTDALRKLRSL
jgi:hypothetical protein